MEKNAIFDKKRILLIKYRYIGDAILAFPAFNAIREAFPKARIDLLTEPIIGDLLEGNPWGVNVITFEKYHPRTFIGMCKTLKKIKKNNYYISFNFIHEFTMKDMLMVYFLRPKIRVGFSVKNKGFLFTNRVSIEGHKFVSHRGHMVDINLMIPSALDIPIKERIPKLWVVDSAEKFVNEKICENKIGRIIVGVHPGVRNKVRQWPKEYFVDIVKYLSDNLKANIILTGGKEDFVLCEEIRTMSNRNKVFNFAGKTNIKQFISLIKRMSVCISGATSAMHIAAALNTPLIAITGADESMWSPVGNGKIIQLKAKEERPCYDINSGNYAYFKKSLREITPQMVIDSLQSLKGKTV